MKPKSEPKTKSKDPNEERFYRFASALMSVPKRELDKQEAKAQKEKQNKKR